MALWSSWSDDGNDVGEPNEVVYVVLVLSSPMIATAGKELIIERAQLIY